MGGAQQCDYVEKLHRKKAFLHNQYSALQTMLTSHVRFCHCSEGNFLKTIKQTRETMCFPEVWTCILYKGQKCSDGFLF